MCTIGGSISIPVSQGLDQDYREARNPTARHDDVTGAMDAGFVHDANGTSHARLPSCPHGASLNILKESANAYLRNYVCRYA